MNLFLETRLARISLYIRDMPCLTKASLLLSDFPFTCPEKTLWSPAIDWINLKDIWRPSPRRLSKKAGYLQKKIPLVDIHALISKHKLYQIRGSLYSPYFSFMFMSRWWANFELLSKGSVSSATRHGTHVIGWTRPCRKTISTICSRQPRIKAWSDD